MRSAINLASLLQGRFPTLDDLLSTVLNDILTVWQKPDGSFRSRRLLLGWDNTPMHRWAQAQLFRSLCLLIYRHAEIAKSQGSQIDPASDSVFGARNGPASRSFSFPEEIFRLTSTETAARTKRSAS